MLQQQKYDNNRCGKHRALEIDPEEYIRCSGLRKKVCPVFADVQVDEQQVRAQWPERAVPTAILQGAQAMDTLHTFNPTLDGPASMRAPTCNLPSRDEDVQIVDDDADATEHGVDEDGEDATARDAGVASEHADASTLPLDMPAEFLIGMQEDDAHEPVDLMVVFQKIWSSCKRWVSASINSSSDVRKQQGRRRLLLRLPI